LEKKRTAAEEEAGYLRSVLDKKNPDLKGTQGERIRELELQLQETLADYTELQSKVSQWAKTSKKNQEGRIIAESAQKILEEEKKVLQKNLSMAMRSSSRKGSVEGNSREFEQQVLRLENKLGDKNNEIEDLKSQLDSFRADFDHAQAEKQDLSRKLDKLRKENQSLQDRMASQNEFQNLSKRISVTPSNEAKMLQHELKVMEQRYNSLVEEKQRLESANRELTNELESNEDIIRNLNEKMHDQEEYIHTVGQLRIENGKLQKIANTATERLQQKQLNIEMLQAHLDRVTAQLGPLQQSADDFEDLKDSLELERSANQELAEKLQQYAEQSMEYQEKIRELSKGNPKRQSVVF
jgi:chromosome segregation ATPase